MEYADSFYVSLVSLAPDLFPKPNFVIIFDPD
jgi:hypothetical protein